MIANNTATAMLDADIASVKELLAHLQAIRAVTPRATQTVDYTALRERFIARFRETLDYLAPRPIAPDACYADCISPNVPPGHDTILGHLARHHADVLDLIDPTDPADTVRDGFKLTHWCRIAGYEPVWVDAPMILARAGIFTVRAYPLHLLTRRWR